MAKQNALLMDCVLFLHALGRGWRQSPSCPFMLSSSWQRVSSTAVLADMLTLCLASRLSLWSENLSRILQRGRKQCDHLCLLLRSMRHQPHNPGNSCPVKILFQCLHGTVRWRGGRNQSNHFQKWPDHLKQTHSWHNPQNWKWGGWLFSKWRDHILT